MRSVMSVSLFVSVCPCFKGKWLKLSTSNSLHIQFLGSAFNLSPKDHGYQVCSKHGYACQHDCLGLVLEHVSVDTIDNYIKYSLDFFRPIKTAEAF